MFTIKDENNVLYKYGLSNYLKRVEEEIQKDFPNFEPNIEIETIKVDSDMIKYYLNVSVSKEYFSVTKYDHEIPEISTMTMKDGRQFNAQLTISEKFIGDTSLTNYFAVVLLIRTLYHNKEVYEINLDTIKTELRKYWAPSSIKGSPTYVDNPELFLLSDIDWKVAIKQEVMHYRATSSKSLNALVNVEFNTEMIGNVGLKGEIVQKTAYTIIEHIFNSAMAAGLEFVAMTKYNVYIDLNNNLLTLKIILDQTIDDNIVKEVEFSSPYMVFPKNKYIINPKRVIAQLMINMYLWYQTAVNHMTSIDEEEFSIFKDSIMCNIDVNI